MRRRSVLVLDNSSERERAWKTALGSFDVKWLLLTPREIGDIPAAEDCAVLCHIRNFVDRAPAYDALMQRLQQHRPVVYSGGPLVVETDKEGNDWVRSDRDTWRLSGHEVVVRRPLSEGDAQILAEALSAHWPSTDSEGFRRTIEGDEWPRAVLSLYFGALMLDESFSKALPEEVRWRVADLDWAPVARAASQEALRYLGVKATVPPDSLAKENAGAVREWARKVLEAASVE
jgi:hypothetical protein